MLTPTSITTNLPSPIQLLHGTDPQNVRGADLCTGVCREVMQYVFISIVRDGDACTQVLPSIASESPSPWNCPLAADGYTP